MGRGIIPIVYDVGGDAITMTRVALLIGLVLLFSLGYTGLEKTVVFQAESQAQVSSRIEAEAVSANARLSFWQLKERQQGLVRSAALDLQQRMTHESGEQDVPVIEPVVVALLGQVQGRATVTVFGADGKKIFLAGTGSDIAPTSRTVFDARALAPTIALERTNDGVALVAAAPIDVDGRAPYAAIALAITIDAALLSSWTKEAPLALVGVSGEVLVAHAAGNLGATLANTTSAMQVNGHNHALVRQTLDDDSLRGVSIVGFGRERTEMIAEATSRFRLVYGLLFVLCVILVLSVSALGERQNLERLGLLRDDRRRSLTPSLGGTLDLKPMDVSRDLPRAVAVKSLTTPATSELAAPPTPVTPSVAVSAQEAMPSLFSAFPGGSLPPETPVPNDGSRPGAAPTRPDVPDRARAKGPAAAAPAPMSASQSTAVSSLAGEPDGLRDVAARVAQDLSQYIVPTTPGTAIPAGSLLPNLPPLGGGPGAGSSQLTGGLLTVGRGMSPQPEAAEQVNLQALAANLRTAELSRSADLLPPASMDLPPRRPRGDTEVDGPRLPGQSTGDVVMYTPFDEAHYRQVFDDFVGSKRQLGDSVDHITLEGFMLKLRKSEQSLIEQHRCRTVRFQVVVRDRQVSLRPQLVR